jgi:hypothetical protein
MVQSRGAPAFAVIAGSTLEERSASNSILSRASGDGCPLAREAAERGDDGTNDLIVSQVVRTNELRSWFVGEHLQAHDDEVP